MRSPLNENFTSTSVRKTIRNDFQDYHLGNTDAILFRFVCEEIASKRGNVAITVSKFIVGQTVVAASLCSCRPDVIATFFRR